MSGIIDWIDNEVKTNDVVVFMKGTPASPMCGFSRAVCQILDYHGVRNVAAVNVLDDEDIRSEIKTFSYAGPPLFNRPVGVESGRRSLKCLSRAILWADVTL